MLIFLKLKYYFSLLLVIVINYPGHLGLLSLFEMLLKLCFLFLVTNSLFQGHQF